MTLGVSRPFSSPLAPLIDWFDLNEWNYNSIFYDYLTAVPFNEGKLKTETAPTTHQPRFSLWVNNVLDNITN